MTTNDGFLENMRKFSEFMEALMLEREAYRLTLAEYGTDGWEPRVNAHLIDPDLQAFARKAVAPFLKCIEDAAEAADIMDGVFPAFDA